MTDHAVLNAEDHLDLRIDTARSAGLGDTVMSCVTFPDEFRRVQNEYPILFRLGADRENFTAFAMFGFEPDENLFLSSAGWDARYVPLAIDIQPFLIGRPAPGMQVGQVHIDMAHPRIGAAEGVRVFDAHGRATPYLETIAEKLGDLDIGYRGAGDFFAALRRHDLLEPFTLEITLDDRSINRLVSFHVIDEERLRALDAAALAELHAAGHLMAIFMAIASLGNLGTLIARKNRRHADG